MSFNVLVLDDEPWQLAWLDDLVSSKGGTVEFAPDYDAAVAAFTTNPPALAVVDVRIGETAPAPTGRLQNLPSSYTGLRFLHWIRVDQKTPAKKTLVYVYTGLDREEIYTYCETMTARFYSKYEASQFRKDLERQLERLGRT